MGDGFRILLLQLRDLIRRRIVELGADLGHELRGREVFGWNVLGDAKRVIGSQDGHANQIAVRSRPSFGPPICPMCTRIETSKPGGGR